MRIIFSDGWSENVVETSMWSEFSDQPSENVILIEDRYQVCLHISSTDKFEIKKGKWAIKLSRSTLNSPNSLFTNSLSSLFFVTWSPTFEDSSYDCWNDSRKKEGGRNKTLVVLSPSPFFFWLSVFNLKSSSFSWYQILFTMMYHLDRRSSFFIRHDEYNNHNLFMFLLPSLNRL